MGRARPAASRSHRFIAPLRSELNAIDVPSGDQAPRLFSRVVATTGSAGPVAAPVDGSTGSRQMSAFCLRMAQTRRPDLATSMSSSWPGPAVSCSMALIGVPSASTAMRQMLMPPPRYDEKMISSPDGDQTGCRSMV